jgi:hypothetical protein
LIDTSSGVEHFSERHALRLFTDIKYDDAFTRAGLDVVHDEHGLEGLGVYIGSARNSDGDRVEVQAKRTTEEKPDWCPERGTLALRLGPSRSLVGRTSATIGIDATPTTVRAARHRCILTLTPLRLGDRPSEARREVRQERLPRR